MAKHAHLTPVHLFSPVVVETTGVFDPRTKAILKELDHQMTQTMGEEAATTYLIQRLSVAVQQGNCASVKGTTGQLKLPSVQEGPQSGAPLYHTLNSSFCPFYGVQVAHAKLQLQDIHALFVFNPT